jgi:hypothetical protein
MFQPFAGDKLSRKTRCHALAGSASATSQQQAADSHSFAPRLPAKRHRCSSPAYKPYQAANMLRTTGKWFMFAALRLEGVSVTVITA